MSSLAKHFGAGISVLLMAAAASPAGQFSYAPWNNDSTAGISSNFTYTCAVNLEGSTITPNGVTFTGEPNRNPSGPGYSVSGMANEIGGDDANNVTGVTREMAKRFHYNGNPITFVFSGLTAGRQYRATLFSVAWEDGTRAQTFFASGGDSLVVNQDVYGNNNGIRVLYDYTADVSGSVTITVTPVGSGSFHLYGFSNHEVLDTPYVDNGGFEWPVITGNGGVWEYRNDTPGWIHSAPGMIGLTVNSAPWAGSGVFPEGNQVAFIQYNGGSQTLSQEFVNLTPGEPYRLSYRYAGRPPVTTDPRITVTLDGQTLQDTIYPRNVGAGNPFYLGAYAFTATGTTANVTFANTRGTGDSAVLLDDLRLETAGSTGWTLGLWTDDASSGVDAAARYTHAVNLGDVNAAVVNGITFKAAGYVTHPNEGTGGANYSTVLPSRFGADDANSLNTGGSATLANRFCYGPIPVNDTNNIALYGLVPGVTYETTVFGVAWDPQPGARIMGYSVNGSAEVTFNEDVHGNNNGVRFSYRGIADANGVISVTGRIINNNQSFHTYAFANKAEPDADLFLADTFAGHNGEDNSLNISARAPDHANRAETPAYIETGMNHAFYADIQNGTARVGANAGASIDIDTGTRVKPVEMRIQADLKVGTLSGPVGAFARGVGLGFYRDGTYTSNVEVGSDFTGLVLAPDGSLYLYEDGAYSGITVAHSGGFDANTFYTLSYEVDVETGTISNISLEGSTADYSPLTAAASLFDDDRTALAGFTGSSSAGGTYGYVDNLIITEITPGTGIAGTVFRIR